MLQIFVNNSATPIGLWDVDAVHVVVPAYGGTVAIEPDDVSQEIIDIYGTATAVVEPVNLVAPSISGNAVVGATLTADVGTWAGADTYAYAWFADDVVIAGQTASTYEVDEGDAGKNITVTVTATNDEGSTPATSAPVGPVDEE